MPPLHWLEKKKNKLRRGGELACLLFIIFLILTAGFNIRGTTFRKSGQFVYFVVWYKKREIITHVAYKALHG